MAIGNLVFKHWRLFYYLDYSPYYRDSGWNMVCTEQNGSKDCHTYFRLYADDACFCVFNSIYFIFWNWCCTRDYCFVYFCDCSNDPHDNLGIQEVPKDLIEAANAFGSNSSQKLFKVQLPLAMPTIMAGVNQSIMLALSMVVTASLVGAPGLGADVYRAVSQIDVGQGFEAGLSIVFIAIILDRITQNLRNPAYNNKLKPKIVFSIFAVLFIGTAIVLAIPEGYNYWKSE